MFSWLINLFKSSRARKAQEERWANIYNDPNTPVAPNKLPLEPEKDPWRT